MGQENDSQNAAYCLPDGTPLQDRIDSPQLRKHDGGAFARAIKQHQLDGLGESQKALTKKSNPDYLTIEPMETDDSREKRRKIVKTFFRQLTDKGVSGDNSRDGKDSI